jgi:hypothetical protein
MTALSTDDLIKVAGLTGAVIAYVVGLMQYRTAQQWKRKELAASEFEKFASRPQVQLVLTVLDWKDREVELFPKAEEHQQRFRVVSDNDLAGALRPHQLDSGRFDYIEVAIRDAFDGFLTDIERFDAFLEAGLLHPEDLQPYFHYWVDQMTCNLREPLHNAFWTFVRAYKYTAVITFVERLSGRPMAISLARMS